MPSDRLPPRFPTFDNVEGERRHRKQRLAAAFRLFGQFGFDEGIAGHITARDPESRLILMTTAGTVPLHRFDFAGTDTILLGRESAGVPQAVHETADARIVIPLRSGARSLNVAQAGAIALFEALRQTGGLPAR